MLGEVHSNRSRRIRLCIIGPVRKRNLAHPWIENTLVQRGFRIYYLHIKCAIRINSRLRNNGELSHIGVSNFTGLYLEIRNGYILYIRAKIKHKRRCLVVLPLLADLQEVSLRQVLHERMLMRVLELLAHLQYRFLVTALCNRRKQPACNVIQCVLPSRNKRIADRRADLSPFARLSLLVQFIKRKRRIKLKLHLERAQRINSLDVPAGGRAELAEKRLKISLCRSIVV